MQRQSFFSLLTSCTIAAVSLMTGSEVRADIPTRFICASGFDPQTKQLHPTTYAWTERGKIPLIRWKYEWFNNPDITPESRCRQVSRQFQEAYDKGSLKYITSGKVNKQPVVCTAREDGGTCATTLFTLRDSDDPIIVAEEVSNLLNGRGMRRPIQHSRGEARVYYQIDIEQFLQTAPVEKE